MTTAAHERAAVLAARSWPSITGRPLVLVPIGSTEQHGAHLPFSTDTIVAAAVADAVATRIGPDAVVAPPVEYGASGEHEDFPGTVSIGEDALAAMLVELIRSLSRWAGRIVLVNGHGGNVGVLASVVPRMIGEHHSVAWLPCGVAGSDAHAGRTETSLLLHLAPDLVDLRAVEPGDATPIDELMPRLRAEGVRAVSPSGVLGDPAGASASKGEALFDRIVADAAARVAGDSVGPEGMLRTPS